MVIASIFSSVIVYPFLHESGHILFSFFAGAKIVNYGIFPSPFVECDVSGVGENGQILIALGGILVTFCVNFFGNIDNFFTWYMIFLLRMINLFSVIFSLIYIFMYLNGVIFEQSDVIKILQKYPEKSYIFCVVCLLLGCISMKKMIDDKPLARCFAYFDV